MYNIGVDLGGTNIAVGIVDEGFQIVHRGSVPTNVSGRTADEITMDIVKLAKRLMEEKNLTEKDIDSIGIASPGIADHNSGIVVYSCNLPFRNYPIAEKVAEWSGIGKVYLENDANAAAWGEAVAGAASDATDSLMITLGTGVGGGIIIGRKIFSGYNCAGAELGHIVIQVGGKPCGCGRKGCWEAYSSATGLINMTKEKIAECAANDRVTLMAKAEKISGRTAFECMRAGDKAAEEVVNTYCEYLASGIASMVNIFQPEVISIGGGISNEGQFLLDRIVPLVRREQYGTELVQTADIRIAKLGNLAGIIGAAALELAQANRV